MLTAQLMSLMDDAHLVAAIEAELDPLTSTDIERELLNRFESKIDGDADYAEIIAVIDEFEIEVEELRELAENLFGDIGTTVAILKVISDAGIASADSLTAELDLAKSFSALAEDAGDTITRLSQLITGATA